jgi:ribonucleotide reductase alpha subunit
MLEAPYDQLPMLGVDPLHGQKFLVRKRDGRLDEFNEARIYLAIEAAFKAVAGMGRDDRLPDALLASVKQSTEAIAARVLSRAVRGEELEVEKIQDAVEEELMLSGRTEAARRYILYREERRRARALREVRLAAPASAELPPPAALAEQPPDFPLSVSEGEYLKLLAPELLDFDLTALGRHLRPERDDLLSRSDREEIREHLLLKDGNRTIETIQGFWMRVAMGLALNEGDQAEMRALEFYEALSTLRFLPSDAVLRLAGSTSPILAFSRDVSSVGAVESVKWDSGAICVWLEPWDAAVTDFLRPAPAGQSFTKGLWIPDLFLRRVQDQGQWTLLDPAGAADLHSLHGGAFEEGYRRHEQRAKAGKSQNARVVDAASLWRDIIESIHQGGDFVIGFKDTINIRAASSFAGGVRHAGFGEGFLGGSPGVLGSINLAAFLSGSDDCPLDLVPLRAAVRTAVRMLDNALDLSFYPSPFDRERALASRVIGLGVHGFAEALESLRIREASAEAVEFADRCAESLAWCGILASSELAADRGPSPEFYDSKWSAGIMPMDTLAELERFRGFGVALDRSSILDWNLVRQTVLRNGMRHTSVTACGLDSALPTADANPLSAINLIARRQKWIDMAHPLSFPRTHSTSDELSQWCLAAWRQGLKIASTPATPSSAHPKSIFPTQTNLAHSTPRG